jgi:hypothetical protein
MIAFSRHPTHAAPVDDHHHHHHHSALRSCAVMVVAALPASLTAGPRPSPTLRNIPVQPMAGEGWARHRRFVARPGRVRTVRQKPPNTDCESLLPPRCVAALYTGDRGRDYCHQSVLFPVSPLSRLQRWTQSAGLSCDLSLIPFRLSGSSQGRRHVHGRGRGKMAFLSFLPSLALMAVWNASATIGIPSVGAPCVGCVPLAAWDFVGRPHK